MISEETARLWVRQSVEATEDISDPVDVLKPLIQWNLWLFHCMNYKTKDGLAVADRWFKRLSSMPQSPAFLLSTGLSIETGKITTWFPMEDLRAELDPFWPDWVDFQTKGAPTQHGLYSQLFGRLFNMGFYLSNIGGCSGTGNIRALVRGGGDYYNSFYLPKYNASKNKFIADFSNEFLLWNNAFRPFIELFQNCGMRELEEPGGILRVVEDF